MYSIDNFVDKNPEDFMELIKESDYVGFANPIYGASIPPIMKKFVAFLTEACRREPIVKKPIFIINTFGYVNAFGPFEAKRLFDKNYLQLQAYSNIRLCNNISTYQYKAKPVKREKMDIRKEKAVTKLEFLYTNLLKSKKSIDGIGLYLLPGILIRKKAGYKIKKNYQVLSVKDETCKRCMVCVKNCPTHAISYDGKDFVFSDVCTSCMRCYNFCPTASILVNGVFTNPTKYIRYIGPE